jgi:hypothetical protein
MIKIDLNQSGTLQHPERMKWLARRLREVALLSSWPENLHPDRVWKRALDIYDGVVASGATRDHVVTFVIENIEPGQTRPEHPTGAEKNFAPLTNYQGWYFQLVPVDHSDDSVVSTQHMGHQIPGPTEVPAKDYSHLSNRDIANLLGCNRLLAFQSAPEYLKGKELPTGTELIEEIQRRLHNTK